MSIGFYAPGAGAGDSLYQQQMEEKVKRAAALAAAMTSAEERQAADDLAAAKTAAGFCPVLARSSGVKGWLPAYPAEELASGDIVADAVRSAIAKQWEEVFSVADAVALVQKHEPEIDSTMSMHIEALRIGAETGQARRNWERAARAALEEAEFIRERITEERRRQKEEDEAAAFAASSNPFVALAALKRK